MPKSQYIFCDFPFENCLKSVTDNKGKIYDCLCKWLSRNCLMSLVSFCQVMILRNWTVSTQVEEKNYKYLLLGLCVLKSTIYYECVICSSIEEILSRHNLIVDLSWILWYQLFARKLQHLHAMRSHFSTLQITINLVWIISSVAWELFGLYVHHLEQTWICILTWSICVH